jgi:hypothetical protein
MTSDEAQVLQEEIRALRNEVRALRGLLWEIIEGAAPVRKALRYWWDYRWFVGREYPGRDFGGPDERAYSRLCQRKDMMVGPFPLRDWRPERLPLEGMLNDAAETCSREDSQ